MSSGVLVIGLVLARPTLFPQFTINAGLAAAAAVVGLRAYERGGGLATLLASGCLAFAGYLIRKEEFFLVLAVALPLLPWRALRPEPAAAGRRRGAGWAIAAASFLDHRAYSGAEWQRYLGARRGSREGRRLPRHQRLKQRPEIPARHGLSMNDVDLFHHFFVVDPQHCRRGTWRRCSTRWISRRCEGAD
jgi:hypothetical protein